MADHTLDFKIGLVQKHLLAVRVDYLRKDFEGLSEIIPPDGNPNGNPKR